MMEFELTARRIDSHGSVATCKDAELVLDTDLKGRAGAFNPAELMLAAVAACILKNMLRIGPMIHLSYRDATVKVHGTRRDAPPKMVRIEYEIEVDTEDQERKLDLMLENIRKLGTVHNTLAPGAELSGIIRRRGSG